MKAYNIAILGTRGIPNHYGGFEQFAEYLSNGLTKKGHAITVYNSHNHPFQSNKWNNITIVHRFDPEYLLGAFGQFIYDFNCIWDARKKNFDIILQLGYTSSSVWSFLFPKKPVIITNMDGLEWKRTKYSKWVKKFLKYAEKIAVKTSDYLIADSPGIQSYLKHKYQADSFFIPYAAIPFMGTDAAYLNKFQVRPYEYDILIARMEPENNIEVILGGAMEAKTNRQFLVIGNYKTAYGRYLKTKFEKYSSIQFLGAVYDIVLLNNLRYFSNLYFHGHSVGGTNPSLLEAMASGALICAHQNIFNESVLGADAYYFTTVSDVKNILRLVYKNEKERDKINNNNDKIIQIYNWENIISQYEKLFIQSLNSRKK